MVKKYFGSIPPGPPVSRLEAWIPRFERNYPRFHGRPRRAAAYLSCLSRPGVGRSRNAASPPRCRRAERRPSRKARPASGLRAQAGHLCQCRESRAGKRGRIHCRSYVGAERRGGRGRARNGRRHGRVSKDRPHRGGVAARAYGCVFAVRSRHRTAGRIRRQVGCPCPEHDVRWLAGGVLGTLPRDELGLGRRGRRREPKMAWHAPLHNDRDTGGPALAGEERSGPHGASAARSRAGCAVPPRPDFAPRQRSPRVPDRTSRPAAGELGIGCGRGLVVRRLPPSPGWHRWPST
jgi:hypothetical protein